MPGLLDTADVAKLGSTETSSFDRLFVDLMTKHHKGAVAMADSELRRGGDPRLRIMAHAIRHEQQRGSRLCAVWAVDSRSPMPFETCSPTTSTPNGMERLIGTPVERIIARMERISSRGRA